MGEKIGQTSLIDRTVPPGLQRGRKLPCANNYGKCDDLKAELCSSCPTVNAPNDAEAGTTLGGNLPGNIIAG